METILELLLVFGGIWGLLAWRAPAWAWISAIGLYLTIWPALHNVTFWALIPVWMIFIPASVVTGVPIVRRSLISRPFLEKYRRMMPSSTRSLRGISRT